MIEKLNTRKLQTWQATIDRKTGEDRQLVMTRVVTRVVTLMTSHPESLTRSVTHTTLVQFNTKLHHRYHCPWFISSCLSLSTEKSHSRSYFLPFEFRVLSIEDSVTIFIPSHTLFLWTILWILSYRNNDLLISYHIFWSYLLILSLDLILSDRWSYLTDDLMFP